MRKPCTTADDRQTTELTRRRRYKVSEEFLREHYLRVPTRELAARFDVTPGQIRRLAMKLGLAITRPNRGRGDLPPWGEADNARLRELHATGLSQKRIAEVMKFSVPTIATRMQRLGLENNHVPNGNWWYTISPEERAVHLERLRKQVNGWPKCVNRPFSPEAANKYAAEYGLPPGLRLREVQIVILLTDGPQTRCELAERLGVNRRSLSAPAGSPGRRGSAYLTHLIQVGLVCRSDEQVKNEAGKGRGQSIFFLTDTALAMLAGKEDSHGR